MEENSLMWKNTQGVLQSYADYLYDNYKDKLTDSGRVASGQLIQSVSTDVSMDGQTIQVELSLADYWKYVEWDTKPHWCPITPLLEWVKVKKIIPRPMANGKLPTLTQLAYMVQHKIARVGTTGSHDLQQSLEETNAKFTLDLKDAIRKDIGGDVLSYMKILRLD